MGYASANMFACHAVIGEAVFQTCCLAAIPQSTQASNQISGRPHECVGSTTREADIHMEGLSSSTSISSCFLDRLFEANDVTLSMA